MAKAGRREAFRGVEKYQLEAMGYRILVEHSAVEEKSKGGIVITTGDVKCAEARAKDMGIVIGIGPLAYRPHGGPKTWADGGLHIGDFVVFNRYDGKFMPPLEDDPDNHGGYSAINDEDIVVRIRPKVEKENR